MEPCACGNPSYAALLEMVEPINGSMVPTPPGHVRFACWECMLNTLRVEHDVFGKVIMIRSRNPTELNPPAPEVPPGP